MPFGPFKFKKSNAPTRLAEFDAQPSWADLASKIAQLFNIPLKDVGVTYFDKAKDAVTITNEEELQRFYYKPFKLDQSSEEHKFVVQDLRTPDAPTTIASTWSAHSNLSDLSKTDMWCLIEGDSTPFRVTVPDSASIDGVKELIYEKRKGDFRGIGPGNLVLWKLKNPIPIKPIDDFSERTKSIDDLLVELKDPTDIVSDIFPNPFLEKHLHLVIRLPSPVTASRKRSRSSSAEGGPADKRKHTATITPSSSGDSTTSSLIRRKWSVDGALHASETGFYYLDPVKQYETKLCLDAVCDRKLVLLLGARSSGKTTRLFRLHSRLKELGFRPLYFSFERLQFDVFWQSLGTVIRLDISSQDDFFNAFATGSWKRPVVLLIDEFDKLSFAPDSIRDGFLQTLREIRNNRLAYAIQSVIAAGTFSILKFSTTLSSLAPFNVTNVVQNPYFTVEDTRALFQEFQEDNDVVVDDDIIMDVWAKSNGHPGMVCLCGRIISNRLNSLLAHDSRTLPYCNWEKIPVEVLYGEIFAYNTFRSLIQSLRSPHAKAAVQLLRSRFSGFLDDVTLQHEDEGLADFLTAEGVLLRPE